MKRVPFRPIAAGILLGTAVFLAPFFLLRAVLMVALIGAIFRAAGRRRHHMHHQDHYHYGRTPQPLSLRNRDAAEISID